LSPEPNDGGGDGELRTSQELHNDGKF
jgi:hypothetical protein